MSACGRARFETVAGHIASARQMEPPGNVVSSSENFAGGGKIFLSLSANNRRRHFFGRHERRNIVLSILRNVFADEFGDVA